MGLHLRRKHADGSAEDRNLLGGKGAYLAEMSRLGLPVPPGFTISTEVAPSITSVARAPWRVGSMVNEALDLVGKIADANFGDVEDPLLVSLRSGSRASMPGMMDTVLNLGLNDQTVEGLAATNTASAPTLNGAHRSVSARRATF